MAQIANQWENLPINPILFDLRPNHWLQKWDKRVSLVCVCGKWTHIIFLLDTYEDYMSQLLLQIGETIWWGSGQWNDGGSNICNFQVPGPQSLMWNPSHSLLFLILSEYCETIGVVASVEARNSGTWVLWWCWAHCWPCWSVIWMRNKLLLC